MNNYLKPKSNIKFTLPFYAQALGISFEFDPPLDKEPGWSRLCRAIEKRNQLMHPKSQDDLSVSDSDLEDALCAASWFVEQLDRLESLAFQRLRQFLSRVETGRPDSTVEFDSVAADTP